MGTLAEKLGINLEDIKKLGQKKDFKLPDFTRFEKIKSEGSSDEILEWKDSFTEPLDSSTIEVYHQNPELFYQDAVRRMRELFLGVCRFMGAYSEGIVGKKLDVKEAGGALLMALHLFWYTCDIIWKYDRLLETKDAEVSPLGMIYQDIKKIVKKVAERKGYDETWVERTSTYLFSSPDYESPTLKLFSDCLSLMQKYPLIKDVLEKEGEKEKILSEIKNKPDLYEQVRKVASKYYCEPWGIIESFLTLKSNPELIESYRKEKRSSSEKILEEIRSSLSPEEFEKLEKARAKIKWFMDVQEINEFIISKNKTSMEALGLLFSAIEEYFKENLTFFIREEHQNDIRKIISSLFEKDIPRGQYYFLPTLRKLTYQLIVMDFVRDEYKGIYKRELEIWLDPDL